MEAGYHVRPCIRIPHDQYLALFEVLYIQCFETMYVKGGRVMIAFFVNYSIVAFPLHLPTLKRQQFFGAVANSR